VILRAFTIAMSVLVAAACAPSGSGTPNQVSTTFDGNKKLVLAAAYTATAQSIGISVWADVPVGTSGIIETTGPFHLRCEGKFQSPSASAQSPDHLPYLDVGDGGGASFGAPSGHYTVVATIPSVGARTQRSFDAGGSYPDPITGVYEVNIGCVPVADSFLQLHALLPQHVMAVRTWVTRVTDTTNKAKLLPLADEAGQAIQAGDTATAVKAMTQIEDIVRPLATQNPYYDILRDALASIALLTQPPPPS
jgi:hypothetical protein